MNGTRFINILAYVLRFSKLPIYAILRRWKWKSLEVERTEKLLLIFLEYIFLDAAIVPFIP
jgi:hypothetical protein